MNLWLDAVADGRLVHAMFSETRSWSGQGLSVLDQLPDLRSAHRHERHLPTLRRSTWGYTACATCGDVQCQDCGRCGCGAPVPTTRVCSACHLEKGKGQFRSPASIVCRDCE